MMKCLVVVQMSKTYVLNWIDALAKTYDQNKDNIGKTKDGILIPVSHIAVNIPLQINLDADGNFKGADVIEDRDDRRTIIPATEKSAVRTTGITPMPLDDTLAYIAKDCYPNLIKNDKDAERYPKYIKLLKSFTDYVNENCSDTVKKQVNAIYKYISNNNLLSDLLLKAHLFGNELTSVSEIPNKWKGKNKPEIYEAIGSSGDLSKTYVRFNVRGLGLDITNSFEDKALYKAWEDYYMSIIKDHTGIDYTDWSNPNVVLASTFPKGILRSKPKAKLISANDKTTFTYRGRAIEPEDIATIGYLKLQKATHALSWLLNKQGLFVGGRYYLAWGLGSKQASNLLADNSLTQQLVQEYSAWLNQEEKKEPYTDKELATAYRKSLMSGKNNFHGLRLEDNVFIMEIDTATQARADITSYQSMELGQYLSKIDKWYKKISLPRLNRQTGELVDTNYTLRTIADMVNGTKANDDLKKNTISKMMDTILGSQRVSESILMSLYNKSIRPLGFNKNDIGAKYHGWKPTLRVASKLFKTKYAGTYSWGRITKMLSDNINDRSYLYGRLLAVADVLEGDTIRKKQIDRPTNAQRYMSAFAQRPADTWKTIYMNAQPYFLKSKGYRSGQILIDHIFDKLNLNDENIKHLNAPLDGKFLIGYSQQKAAWFKEIAEKKQAKEKQSEKVEEGED